MGVLGRSVSSLPVQPRTSILARSLNEYVRLEANQTDAALRHAIDQLEAWQTMDPASIDNAFAVKFGELTIEDDVNFTFDLPDHARRWPAPQFGRFPLHEKLRKHKALSSGLRQRRRSTHAPVRYRRLKPNKMKPAGRCPQEADSLVLQTSLSVQSMPLRFLDLPAEIRNQVYQLLTVQHDPVLPALRNVFPFRHGRLLKQRHIRRIPLEPALATVNHQVRRESLSTFYGLNRFVLVKNSCQMFQKLSMTNPTTIQKWKPRDGLSTFLKHVDVHFSAMSPRDGVVTWISYGLRRLVNDKFTVHLQTVEMPLGKSSSSKRQPESKKTASDMFCLCTESDTMPQLRAALEAKEAGEDLVQVATFVIQKRLEQLFGVSDGIKTSTYQPSTGHCLQCEKPTFEAVHVGL